MRLGSARALPGLARLAGGLLVVFLALPPAALILTLGAGDFVDALEGGMLAALALSLVTTLLTAALLLLLGTPLAWWLGRRRGRAARAVEALVRLPAVTPPAVAGVALLAAFGRGGLFGDPLAALGVGVPFTPAAVVLAQLFVAAPFYVLPLAEAFAELDEDLLWTARSLGAGPARAFFRIALPLCGPALLGGLAVAWARALGEFGATLVFAGNLPGVTQTLPIGIYAAMEGDLGPARAMAAVLLGVAVILFVALRSAPVERLVGLRR
ncbi:MAG TPA: molybdate ABC transporter permease subunit [Sandaracinaceae bacterium LLY-WYZ-13_1]|nr:molybdate ABC transporter permease subunit [Sandaracinaceae bacterium LLY-WYZ-13_1]